MKKTKITMRLHDSGELLTGEGDCFFEAVLKLLDSHLVLYSGSREYAQEFFENIAALGESDEVVRSDFSTPEDNYTLTVEEK